MRQSGCGGKGGGAFLLRISMSMDHLHNRLTFDLGNKKEINYHNHLHNRLTFDLGNKKEINYHS